MADARPRDERDAAQDLARELADLAARLAAAARLETTVSRIVTDPWTSSSRSPTA